MSHMEDTRLRPIWAQLAKELGAKELPESVKDLLLTEHEMALNAWLVTEEREDLEPLIPIARGLYSLDSLHSRNSRRGPGRAAQEGTLNESSKEATPEAGDYERFRAEVLSEYLAKIASIDPKVAHFRSDVLANELLTMDQAHAFCSSPATRFLSRGVWRAFEIPASHSAELLSESFGRTQDGPFHWVQVRTDPAGESHAVFGPQSYEHFTVRNERGRPRMVSFWPGSYSILGELRKICKEITTAHPWDIGEATWFVLTGEVPFVRPIRSTVPTQRLLGGRAHATISLAIQPWVSPEAVELVYRQVQKQVIGGRPGRVSNKNLNLLDFVTARTDRNGNLPRGGALVNEWDRKCKKDKRPTKWCYGANTRKFWRDLRSVQESLANSERAGIVLDKYMPHENVERVSVSSE